MPEVSILLPLHDCEKTIANTLDSICDQTYRDFELIAVDNNCSDNTMNIVESYSSRLPIKSFFCATPGIVAALNTGLKESYTDYIARIDGDDTWKPEKLAKQMKYLKANPDIGVIGTQIDIVDVDGSPISEGTMGLDVVYPVGDNRIKTLLLMGENPICHPSIVMIRKLFEVVGGYESFFPRAEDLHLWLKLIPHTKFANLEEKLTVYTQKKDDDYDARVPLVLADMYYSMYKTVGMVEGERPKRIYDWQLDPSFHGNVR